MKKKIIFSILTLILSMAAYFALDHELSIVLLVIICGFAGYKTDFSEVL